LWLHDSYDVAVFSLILAVILAAGLVAVTLILLQVMRQNGQIMLALNGSAAAGETGLVATPQARSDDVPSAGLAVAAPAPRFTLPSLAGSRVSLDVLRSAGLPVALVFTDPGCGPCAALLPDIVRWQSDLAKRANVVVVGRQDEQLREVVGDADLARVLVQEDRELSDLYHAPATPSALIVTADGRIGSPVAQGAEAIRDLLSAVGQAAVGAAESKSAGELPDVILRDRRGRERRLPVVAPSTIVLFWRDSCPYCERMRADVERYVARAHADGTRAHRLVVIDSGDPHEPSQLPAELEVLTDPEFSVGRMMGVQGTPSALVVGEDGKIPGPPLIGAPPIVALLDDEPNAFDLEGMAAG
jgi:thiol-disulfide isomerase/thioredoxin